MDQDNNDTYRMTTTASYQYTIFSNTFVIQLNRQIYFLPDYFSSLDIK